MKLILASASPRRAQVLRDAGISFSVVSSAIDETPYPEETPQQMVERLADAKAELVAARAVGPAILVAADTVVALDGQVLGKPRSTDDARRMLQLFSGRTHSVAGASSKPRWSPFGRSRLTKSPGTSQPRSRMTKPGVTPFRGRRAVTFPESTAATSMS